MTAPERALRSLVRTEAPPVPGLTCWNSSTVKSPSSILRVMPFLMSEVEIAAMGLGAFRDSCAAQSRQRHYGLDLGRFEYATNCFERQVVTQCAKARDGTVHDARDGADVTKRLARDWTGQVDFNLDAVESSQRVAKRPRRVRESAGVEDNRDARSARGVHGLDKVTFEVGLKISNTEARRARESSKSTDVLDERRRSVDLRTPFAQQIQIW